MIVRMKEIALFTSAKTADACIYQLGELGVVDIEEVEVPSNATIERHKNSIEDVKSAVSYLELHEKQSKNIENTGVYAISDPKRMVERILKAKEFELNAKSRLNDLNQQLNWYKTWGKHVNTKDFNSLKEKGIILKLYVLDKHLLPDLKQAYYIFNLGEIEDKVLVAHCSLNPKEQLKYKAVKIPKQSFESLQDQISRKERQLAELKVFLDNHAHYKEVLKDYQLDLNTYLALEETAEHMGNIEGKCKYLKGYLPKDEVARFKTVANQNNWGYEISEPQNLEKVPVFIKNPKWIEIINPIMKFIDIVPGYKEVDVSIYFLIAFALFFAMLVGDAGYGLIFLLITFLFRKKLSKQMRILIGVLSVSTIIWGVLSGTYFGSETIAQMPVFKALIIENIASFGFDNVSFMMHLSFLIGAIHLSIAHSIRAIQFINSIKALSQLGWIALVWGLFFITEQLVLGIPMPSWGQWLFIVGGLLVTLFSAEHKNVFKSMLSSIANLPLSLISGFSDIVSYVRLFAVGMATAAVAASFNNMILSSGIDNMGILELFMAAIALLLGHGLNIALALMAVMVHGIRLNMLEFSSHLGVDFSGVAYKPFRLMTNENSPKTEKTQP